MNEILERTLTLLEWPELCKRLSDFAVSEMGRRFCLSLLPETSDVFARRQLRLTSEMVNLLSLEANVPLEPFFDLTGLLERAQRRERLSGEDLHQIGAFLSMVRRTHRFFENRPERIPSLSEMVSCLQDLNTLRDALKSSINPDGQINEQASPKLTRLKKEARRSRRMIVDRLEDYLRAREASRMLQDSYYTIREGRYVLPVRADAYQREQGIVHDVSASGATHFVEPSWLVSLNNALRLAEIETKKESERILDDLTLKVADAAEVLQQNLQLMAQLDLLHAKARLSQAIGASEPEVSPAGDMILRGLQHPLLTIRKVSVVPNDLFLNIDERILVISGPNAGGKTVLLKAVGLAVLMQRAGLHIPAQPGSRIPSFETITADIGDQQDLQQDVSTFSGHVEHVRQIMEIANDNSLVILDELAGSTDPQEGTALALAILEDLHERGARVFVTTHYPALKAWAQGHSHARNGAMEFDWERMEPTYRLHMGVPGQSSALEIAGRIGLPEELMERAKAHLHGEETNLESLLRELQEQRSAFEEDRRQASMARRRLIDAEKQQEKLIRSLRDQHEDFVRDKRRRLSAEIKVARQRIREVMKALSKAQKQDHVESSRDTIRDIEESLRPPPPAVLRPSRPLGDVGPGDLVEIVPLGQKGILLDDPKKKRRLIRVRVGSMEVRVNRESLGGVETKQQTGQNLQLSSSIISPKPPEVPLEIDLRGMKVEDALDTVDRFVDQAMLGRTGEFRIVHGHGTGALKKAIRQWLSSCDCVEGFRSGDRYEGGDGATIVRLAERGGDR